MNKVEVVCSYCKKTSVIQVTDEAMASWFQSGKSVAPEWDDERIWEVLKRTAICPDCVKEHPQEPGSHKIGCRCGKCKS
jgi:hypothetical protein